ncbi:MAG: hypothetical protein FWD79_11165 [Desulfobulbus sp.]|nr:hypothetical protein [Desulfobulbus sp.]
MTIITLAVSPLPTVIDMELARSDTEVISPSYMGSSDCCADSVADGAWVFSTFLVSAQPLTKNADISQSGSRWKNVLFTVVLLDCGIVGARPILG